jgi:hypothetical protein
MACYLDDDNSTTIDIADVTAAMVYRFMPKGGRDNC